MGRYGRSRYWLLMCRAGVVAVGVWPAAAHAIPTAEVRDVRVWTRVAWPWPFYGRGSGIEPMPYVQTSVRSHLTVGTVVLTAGAGKSGRRVVNRLVQRGDLTVILGSRSLAAGAWHTEPTD